MPPFAPPARTDLCTPFQSILRGPADSCDRSRSTTAQFCRYRSRSLHDDPGDPGRCGQVAAHYVDQSLIILPIGYWTCVDSIQFTNGNARGMEWSRRQSLWICRAATQSMPPPLRGSQKRQDIQTHSKTLWEPFHGMAANFKPPQTQFEVDPVHRLHCLRWT